MIVPRIWRVDGGRRECLAIRADVRAHTDIVDEDLHTTGHHFDTHRRAFVGRKRVWWITACVAVVTVAVAYVE